MEEELVSGSSSVEGDPKSPPPTVSSIFDQHLPYYLALGMPYNLYWKGDCTAVIAYRRAYEIKRRVEERDLWRQGLYVYEAVLDASPILRAFAKAGTKPLPYPEEPYPVTQKDMEEKLERKNRQQYEEQMSIMEKWASEARSRQRKEASENKDG